MMFFFIIGLFSSSSLFAQVDLAAVLGQIQTQGCLSKEQEEKLAGWLIKAPSSEADQALRLAGDSYQCLLKKNSPVQEVFGQILKERLYSKIALDHLCMRDRLIAALTNLQQIISRPEGQELDEASLNSALNDFLGAYTACGNVQQNPKLPTSVRIARDWCLDPKEPWPPYDFVRAFIEAMVSISAAEPGQGKRLGSVLAVVLDQARSFNLDEREKREASGAYRVLVEPDRQNLAGTSYWFIFQKQLKKIIPRSDWVEPSQIQNLLLASTDLQGLLEKYAERLQNRANAIEPFEEYSALLYNLGNQLEPNYSGKIMRNQLFRQSCIVLRRGIEVSSSLDLQELQKNQQTLLDRVRAYGFELGRSGKYGEVVNFESNFLDPSLKMLTADQQCYLHAHLAQAHYALGDIREAMDEFGRSCGRISIEDLKNIR
jgi:hypothetical protein